VCAVKIQYVQLGVIRVSWANCLFLGKIVIFRAIFSSPPVKCLPVRLCFNAGTETLSQIFIANKWVRNTLLCFMKQLLRPNFLKKSCSLGLERWFDAKLQNSKRFGKFAWNFRD